MNHRTYALEARSQVAVLRQVLNVKCVVVVAEALKVRVSPEDGYGDGGQDKANNFRWLRGVWSYRIKPEDNDGQFRAACSGRENEGLGRPGRITERQADVVVGL